MTVARAERPTFSFSKGINSDASLVVFPPDFSTDESNFELLLDGTRRKRRGLEAESDNILDITQPTDAVVRTFKWRAVGGDPDLNFHCVQIGSIVYFMDDVVEPSDSVRNFTIDLTTVAVEGHSADVGDTHIDMAFGRGHAIIVGKYVEPHFVQYDVDTDSLITTPINIRERDFQGVDDGIDNQTRPGSLTDAYQYNLINQGWIYGDVLTFQTEQGGYPAKNMIPWLGYRRRTVTGFDPNDGTKEFSSDKLIAELFQDAPAPRGHFIRNPFDTNITVAVETETVKNYISLTKPSGHAHFDQLTPPGSPSQENGPNFMNLPSGSNPTTQTLLTFKFNDPHFLSVGDTVTFFTESAGKIGSNSGDGNRLWEITGNKTVEAVVDDNTISFYNTLTNDSAGWRTTWPFSYWPTVYAFAGGDTITIEGTVIDERPTAVAFFAGRAVYAGVPHPSIGSALFFSQVVEVDAQYGKCYQVADPTSDKISDIVATDGLVLRIPEVGRVYRLLAYGSSVLVFASNGLWQVGPGAAGYFSATSYSIRKLSDIQIVNATSVMQTAEGPPCVWASSGIFAVVEDTNTGFLVVRSITADKIDVLYAALGEAVRKTANGDFDPVNKRIVWIYVEDGEYFALVYDLKFQAFTKWKFETPVYDLFTVTERNDADSTLRFLCYDEGFVVSTVSSLTFEDFGTTYDSYMVVGYDTAQSPARKKQAPVVTVFSKRTEINSGEVDGPIASTAAMVALAGSGVAGRRVMTSNDAITWTQQNTPIDKEWLSLAYSEDLQLYIAPGGLGAGVLMYSSDTVNWTAVDIPNERWTCCAWSPTLGIFVALNSSGIDHPYGMTSPDGINWNLESTTPVGSWQCLIWVDWLGLFVAGGSGGTGEPKIMTSPDGVNWTIRTTVLSAVYALVASGSLIVSANRADNINMRSSDGITWITGSTPGGFTDIAYGAGLFVLVSLSGTIHTSPDGITWTERTNPAAKWESIQWSEDLSLFVALSTTNPGISDGHLVATSPDGITWTQQTTPSSADAGGWLTLGLGKVL